MKTHKELSSLYDELKGNFKDDFTTRVHRPLSWLAKSERENEPDANFVFLWITKRAIYLH